MLFPRYLLIFALLVGLGQTGASAQGVSAVGASTMGAVAPKFGRVPDALTGDSKGKKGDPPRPRPKPGPRDGGDDD